MASEIVLPKLGMNMETATIVAWRKREGDIVAIGDILADIETDKAVIELEAEIPGILHRLLAQAGERVDVNRVIAIVGAPGEDIGAIERQLAQAVATGSSHVSQAYAEWRGAARTPAGAAPATCGAPGAPPAPAANDPQRGRPDPEAIRARLARRGVLPGAPVAAEPPRTRVVIYGGGLGAKQLLEVIRHLPAIEVVGVIDDDPALAGTVAGGAPILGGFDALAALVAGGRIDGVVLSFHSEVRKRLHERIRATLDVRIVPLIDPRALVGMEVTVGDGALIEAGAVLGPGTIVGEGAIVDVGAVVAHDCFLGPFSHLSPGCALSGVVCLRENVLVGVGAAINSTVTIGRNVIITPGAAVMHDLPDDVVVSGVPARVIGASRRGE